MACYFPWKPKGVVHVKPMACGQCHGCRLEQSRQWAVRCVHEASLYDENCFITLTTEPSYGWNLVPKDLQDFWKRLRWSIRPRKIRYFSCGEYGEIGSRPHYHACIFGYSFPDRQFLRTSESGSEIYTSKVLESLWSAGMSSIGDVTFESAAYVARYCMKKILGDDRNDIYDPETGEIFKREPEFCRMSLGGGEDRGIGYRWIKRFRSDVYPHGKVVINGKECRPPRYYDKILRASDFGAWMLLSKARSDEMYNHISELAPERLASREIVSKARVALSREKI